MWQHSKPDSLPALPLLAFVLQPHHEVIMQLIGMLDSPFVRRVAIAMRLLALPFEHKVLSVFRDYDKFRALNPAVKVPTLVCDDGLLLVESELILAHVQELAGRTLLPQDAEQRRRDRHVIGLALVASEKSVQWFYEVRRRPEDKRLPSWAQRLHEQAAGAYTLLETEWQNRPASLAAIETQADSALQLASISTAVAWRFTQEYTPELAAPTKHPTLARLAQLAEATPAFRFAPFGEGTVG